MNQILNSSDIFGHWFNGYLWCPQCFEELGRVSPDVIVTEEFFEAQFMDCANCGWPLRKFHEYMYGDEESEETRNLPASTNPHVSSSLELIGA